MNVRVCVKLKPCDHEQVLQNTKKKSSGLELGQAELVSENWELTQKRQSQRIILLFHLYTGTSMELH